MDSIPGSERSPGEGNSNPLQYSCREKSHGQRSLVGCSPWDCIVRHDWSDWACMQWILISVTSREKEEKHLLWRQEKWIKGLTLPSYIISLSLSTFIWKTKIMVHIHLLQRIIVLRKHLWNYISKCKASYKCKLLLKQLMNFMTVILYFVLSPLWFLNYVCNFGWEFL